MLLPCGFSQDVGTASSANTLRPCSDDATPAAATRQRYGRVLIVGPPNLAGVGHRRHSVRYCDWRKNCPVRWSDIAAAAA